MKLNKSSKSVASRIPRPTDLELAILEVLKELGSATVRQVYKYYNQVHPNPAGYTTVLKIIQIMTEKGLVEKDSSQRPQVYKPRVSWSKTQQLLLVDLMKRAFNGSAKQLVLQALATQKATDEELDEIEKLLDKFEGGK
jgi:BlaI family transcriptional regulator, penicillinase repressor